MIIRRIGLRNYRGIESRELEFDAGVNIVEGPNEAGKTSLAEALGLIFDYPDSSTHRTSVPGDWCGAPRRAAPRARDRFAPSCRSRRRRHR